MTETPSPDALKNLLWFMIGLAFLGTLLAIGAYFVLALPPVQDAALHTPLIR